MAWQMQLYMQAMQSGGAPGMPMGLPFMPPMPFMHPDMAAAYGYAPIGEFRGAAPGTGKRALGGGGAPTTRCLVKRVHMDTLSRAWP